MWENAFCRCLFSFYPVTRFSQSRRRRKNKWTSWRMCPHNMRWEILLLSVTGWAFLSSCESLLEMFSPRQPYGSRPHLSSSKKRLRSTCLYLPTAQRPSQACCRNTPSLMSKMPAWNLRKLSAAKPRKRKMDKSRLWDYNVTRLLLTRSFHVYLHDKIRKRVIMSLDLLLCCVNMQLTLIGCGILKVKTFPHCSSPHKKIFSH